MSEIKRRNGIPVRTLGNTGLEVTLLGVGGYHQCKAHDPELSRRIIRTAIDEGVNFLDNAWCYNQGLSERVMGQALEDGYRDKVVLMTKNHGRDVPSFESQLHDSLRRLQTDCIDVVQFHEIVSPEFPKMIIDNGVIEAAVRARDAGKLRFIGFTGHNWPHIFLEMLEADFQWNTVMMPLNLLDAQYRSFEKMILPRLLERNIGVIGMKSLAGGQIRKTGVAPREAMHYTMSLPVSTLVSGMESVEQVQYNIETARTWQPMPEAEQQRLLRRVAPWAGDGRLEGYKE
ncbi:MAG: aldo/keto reductase [Planctomycetota bacterium]